MMIVYLIKSTTCLAIFFLFYKLFLEKETMHIFKRFYLLGILVASFCIPLITFTSYVSVAPMQELALLDQNLMVSTADDTNLPINYLTIILWTVYGFGAFLFALKFFLNISKIAIKIHKNPHYKSNPFVNVLLEDLAVPHTFFNYIFLNKYKFETKQIPQEVIIHEQTHAKQQHSLDVLFIELLQVVFWFNPFVYFIKHSIKLNHEFLADQTVLNLGFSASNYQKILLNFSSTSHHPQLTNAINYSFIKKRFTIMKTRTSKRTSWLRSLILLPLLAILIYGFSEKVTQEELIPKIQETKNNTQVKNVEIAINKSKEILISDGNGAIYATLENLTEEVNKIVSVYNSEQLKNVTAWIQADGTLKMAFITDVKLELRKAGIVRYKQTYTNQDKATAAQLAEYNKLAKHYNALPKDKMVVKSKDIKRLEYIYGLMSEVQKKRAEPFPNFPPPPPPPPIHENKINKGSKELQLAKKQFSKKAENYRKAVHIYYTKAKGNYQDLKPLYTEVMSLHKAYAILAKKEKIMGSPPPPPPPAPERVTKSQKSDIPPPATPPNPLDHMISLAKKGATFYYEDDKISSDKAIDIVKKNKSINIQVLDHDSKNPIVKLSKKSITVEGKYKKQSKWKIQAAIPMIIPKGAIIYINNKKATSKEVEKLDREKIKQINIEKEENKVYITTIK